MMKEWGDARARMEEEIQRKNEHQSFGTNFKEARGFVRQNWESKHWDPEKNPLVYDSSSEYDDEYYDEEVEEGDVTIGGQQPDLREKKQNNDLEDDEAQETTPLKQRESTQEDKSPGTDMRGSRSAAQKIKNRPISERAAVHDLTADIKNYGYRPSTAVQVNQAQSIVAYNQALPKRKKKQALPMISGPNIGAI